MILSDEIMTEAVVALLVAGGHAASDVRKEIAKGGMSFDGPEHIRTAVHQVVAIANSFEAAGLIRIGPGFDRAD